MRIRKERRNIEDRARYYGYRDFKHAVKFLYENRYRSTHEIGTIFDCSPQTVRVVLNGAGVKPRNNTDCAWLRKNITDRGPIHFNRKIQYSRLPNIDLTGIKSGNPCLTCWNRDGDKDECSQTCEKRFNYAMAMENGYISTRPAHTGRY